MKTENPIFTTVIIRKDEIKSFVFFDFEQARIFTVNELKGNFNNETDDGLIFVSDKPTQESKAVFNYRSFISGEPIPYSEPVKKNTFAKLLFSCPECSSTKKDVAFDDEDDLVAICKGCGHKELIFT